MVISTLPMETTEPAPRHPHFFLSLLLDAPLYCGYCYWCLELTKGVMSPLLNSLVVKE